MDMFNYMWNIKMGLVIIVYLVIKLFKYFDILLMFKYWVLVFKLGY